jgi:hypothetical protein
MPQLRTFRRRSTSGVIQQHANRERPPIAERPSTLPSDGRQMTSCGPKNNKLLRPSNTALRQEAVIIARNRFGRGRGTSGGRAQPERATSAARLSRHCARRQAMREHLCLAGVERDETDVGPWTCQEPGAPINITPAPGVLTKRHHRSWATSTPLLGANMRSSMGQLVANAFRFRQ